MGMPTIHKIPTTGLGQKKIDPRDLEIWQKGQGKPANHRPQKRKPRSR